MAEPACPQCGAGVQADWDWCHECGFDPEGLKPADWAPARRVGAEGGTVRLGMGGTTASPRPAGPTASGGPPPGWSPPGAAGSVGPARPAASGSPPPFDPSTATFRYAQPPATSNTGKIVGIVVAVLAALLIVPILAILAVTFLGRSTSAKSVNGTVSSQEDAGGKPAWQTFTPPDGRFTIDMRGVPGKESHADKTATGASVNTVRYAVSSASFSNEVQYFDVPIGGEFKPDALDGVAKSFGEGNGYSVSSTDASAFAGIPARQVTYTKEGQESKCLLLTAGQRFYIICDAGRPTFDPADYQHMLDSFKINS